HTFALEHPTDGVALSQVAAELGEAMPDRCRGAVAVVRQGIGHDRDAGGAVTLVADFFQPLTGELPRPPLDRVLDPVGRHVDVAGLLHRKAQPEVAVGIAAALTRRDRDLTAGAGERLAALGVDDRLLVLYPGPLGMARHQERPPNMLSMILSHDSGKLTPAHLDHVSVFELVLCVDLGPVHAHAL